MKKQLKNTAIQSQTGLTLVELMVAMVISLLLIGGTITIFISNKQTYQVNEASSRVQENGRFSFDFLKNDVRMAGFFGCVSNILDSSNFNNVVKTDNTVTFDGAPATDTNIKNLLSNVLGTNSIKGYAIGATLTSGELFNLGVQTGAAAGDAVPNQDAIAVQIGESCDEGAVVQVMPNTAANIKINDATACGIQQGSVALISDCTGADLFRVSNNPTGANKDTLTFGGNFNTGNLSKAYKQDANVYALRSSIYYIGNSGSVNGGPALFRRIYSGANLAMVNQELVDGIESMNITYGVDTDDDNSANYYVTAANVSASDWANVTSARIRLVSISASGNIVQSGDGKLRHTFTETIKIRNR